MEFRVCNVSRGYIYLESAEKKVVAEGEGLLANDEGLPGYVVYLNSIFTIEDKGKKIQANESQKNNIVEAIKNYFEEKGAIVAFE